MPIVAADLVAYGAASRPEDDTSTSGGAIDADARPNLDQFTANAVAAAISDGTDTRNLTVTGRLATGAIDTEVLALTSAVEVVGSKTWERVLHVVLASQDASRTVTFRQGSGGTTRATLVPNQTDAFIMFIDAASESGATTRFEKIFWRNDHGSLDLTNAEVELTADPGSIIRIGIETALDDTVSVANRETTPSNPTFVDDSVAQGVPGGDLGFGEAIGVWIEMQLAADAAAGKNSFTTQLAGNTV